MPKVDIELVKLVLQRNQIDVRQVARILEDITQEIAAAVDDDKPLAVKKQFVILLSDPRGELKGKDFTGWVVQIPEEDRPTSTEDRLTRAAHQFNASPKGRRMPLKTIGEVCETVPSRILKEQGVWVKTKEPAWVTTTQNKLAGSALGKASFKNED